MLLTNKILKLNLDFRWLNILHSLFLFVFHFCNLHSVLNWNIFKEINTSLTKSINLNFGRENLKIIEVIEMLHVEK